MFDVDSFEGTSQDDTTGDILHGAKDSSRRERFIDIDVDTSDSEKGSGRKKSSSKLTKSRGSSSKRMVCAQVVVEAFTPVFTPFKGSGTSEKPAESRQED